MKKSTAETPAKLTKPGVRALAKKASQDKIVMAARKLFTAHGYDDATLRQIAKTAGLGLTTLFNHIKDKRDLINLIFEEEVTVAADRAHAAIRPWQTFVEKCLTISAFYFQMFSVEPTLSRILLSEILQQTPGPPMDRYLSRRALMIDEFEEIARVAQVAGELRSDLDPRVIARSIQFAFTGASRWWLTDPSPDWRSGQRYFEQIVMLLAEGFNAKPSSTLKPQRTAPLKKKSPSTGRGGANLRKGKVPQSTLHRTRKDSAKS